MGEVRVHELVGGRVSEDRVRVAGVELGPGLSLVMVLGNGVVATGLPDQGREVGEGGCRGVWRGVDDEGVATCGYLEGMLLGTSAGEVGVELLEGVGWVV